MPEFGPAELLIVLLIVTLIFGGSRLAELGGSLGKGVKEFRKALREDDDSASDEAKPPFENLASPATAIPCPHCAESNPPSARFCNRCGTSLTAPPTP